MEYKKILRNSIFGLLVCLNATTVSAEETNLTAADILEIQEAGLTETSKDVIEKSTSSLSYYNDDAYLHYIHKLAYTFPVALINGGQKLELIDGSVWYVNPFQRYQVRQWVQAQTVFIKPSAFSGYPYVLYNRDTSEAVEVQFETMPQYYQMYRQRIREINYTLGLVYLNDVEQTVWQVNPSDLAINFWEKGDYIVVGVNNDWRIAFYPHILINTTIEDAPHCEALWIGNY